MSNRCLICYLHLGKEEIVHERCSKKIFNTTILPCLDYSLEKMEELGKSIVNERLAVTGVQRKLSLSLEKCENQKRLTIVGLWGTYILKPPSEEYPHMVELEDLSMHLASICNIKTAIHSLIRLKSGELAYICKRFDRKGKKKLHVEDMCQLTENLTEAKYNGSMEKVGKTVLKYCTNTGFDVLRLFELVLFSYITGNSDMHLKNFSLLIEDDGTVSLSPSYDLLPTKLLIKDDTEDLALTLNGKKSRFKKKDFEIFSERLNIPLKVSDKIFKKFIEKYDELESFINISFLPGDLKKDYINLISSRLDVLRN
jgi:serine/threonine-protein kinase HipA